MDRKLFFALMMTTLTLLAFNYMTHKRDKSALPEGIQSGQGYRVPTKETLMRPLNRDIDFIDEKRNLKENIINIETDLRRVSFSNHGAIITGMAFKKRLGKENTPLDTVLQKDFISKEDSCFLLGLEEKTPYVYNLVSNEDFGDRVEVTYSVNTGSQAIRKVYSVYKDSYKVDLKIHIQNKIPGSVVQPRILLPAPFVQEVPYNTQSGFIFNKESNRMDTSSGIDKDQAWLIPSLFGAQDKYFAHSLVSDPDGFTQRAYYKADSSGRLVSILEGVDVKDSATFTMSFYMGPKDLADMSAVDSRLESLLNFGWFSWLCKLMLRFLELIYSYVGNFGLAIIILTILVKLPLLPLSMKGAEEMERHQSFQPQINYIRKKYKDDIRMQYEEIARFNKEHNLSTSGRLMGCLPSIIDLLIMFSLYRVLGNYMDLYHAPFIGWITDLSAKDPYYVLPLLMGASMFWQQKISPAMDERSRIMMTFMPLIMTAVFINFASGLVLYWFTKNLLMVGETYLRKAMRR